MSLPSPFVAALEVAPPGFVSRRFTALAEFDFLGITAWQWVAMVLALLLAVGAGVLLSRLTLRLSRIASRRPAAPWVVALGHEAQGPLTALLSLVAFTTAVHFIGLVGRADLVLALLARGLAIAGLAWLLIAAGGSLTESLVHGLSGHDEYRSRGVRTQLLIAHRAFSVIIVLGAAVAVLSGFHAIRNLGVSLLASAGIASVVLGIAAQKTLGGFLAGIQLSITQPVRLGDTVVFDAEFGTVEEIRLTYVVLRLWDLRRMVVPVSKFLDNTFQNWTRVPTHLLGSADLWVDYSTPLEPLRAEFSRVCHASPLWDRDVCGLQVTEATDRAMKLRLLVSAETAGKLFDLRCEVREKMIAHLQQLEGGNHLPVTRNADVTPALPRTLPPAQTASAADKP